MRKLIKKSVIKKPKASKRMNKGNKPKQVMKSNKSTMKALVGKKRLLSDIQTERLKKMHASGKHSAADISAKFNISLPTLYNYLKRK